MLARFVVASLVVVLVVFPTFDLRYSGLLGPKRQTSDAPSL